MSFINKLDLIKTNKYNAVFRNAIHPWYLNYTDQIYEELNLKWENMY